MPLSGSRKPVSGPFLVLGRMLTGLAAVALVSALATPSVANDARAEITINGRGVFPENVAASSDGTVYFGSMTTGTIYRARPGTAAAEPWIKPIAGKMKRVMGLLPDERRGLLWACAFGDGVSGPQPTAATAIKSFDLKTGAFRASYPFEDGGRCNDLAIAPDGTVYATDFEAGRIMRLARGQTVFRPWSVEPGFASADGIALLADGHVYFNTFRTNHLLRVPVGRDGRAGQAVRLTTDRPLQRPDGMRAVGPDTLLLVEGEGRLVEVTVAGDTATVRVLKEGLTDSPTGVALVGDTAFVVRAKFAQMRDLSKDAGVFGALAIPYAPAN